MHRLGAIVSFWTTPMFTGQARRSGGIAACARDKSARRINAGMSNSGHRLCPIADTLQIEHESGTECSDIS